MLLKVSVAASPALAYAELMEPCAPRMTRERKPMITMMMGSEPSMTSVSCQLDEKPTARPPTKVTEKRTDMVSFVLMPSAMVIESSVMRAAISPALFWS